MFWGPDFLAGLRMANGVVEGGPLVFAVIGQVVIRCPVATRVIVYIRIASILGFCTWKTTSLKVFSGRERENVIVHIGDSLIVTRCSIFLLPHYVGDKILLPKH